MSKRLAPTLPSVNAALELLEVLADRNFDAVLITDGARDQRIIYCNAAFERLTGYAVAEILGRSPKLLQGPSTDRTETARLGKCLINRESFEGQAVNYKKDGTPFMMSWRVDPVVVNEQVVAWLAIQREVAMQWQAD